MAGLVRSGPIKPLLVKFHETVIGELRKSVATKSITSFRLTKENRRRLNGGGPKKGAIPCLTSLMPTPVDLSLRGCPRSQLIVLRKLEG
jgi:hypothetical protein